MKLGKMLLFFAVGAGGVILGKYVSEKFVLKEDENDPDGFLLMQPGFGLDEVVMGLIQFAGGYYATKMIVGKKG
jgi:hypothetical protein